MDRVLSRQSAALFNAHRKRGVISVAAADARGAATEHASHSLVDGFSFDGNRSHRSARDVVVKTRVQSFAWKQKITPSGQ